MYHVMKEIDQLYRLVWLSRPLMQAAEAAVGAGLAGTGLTVRMRAILEILFRDGDATVPQIAQGLEIKRQYVQVMVDETLAAGLTERRPNPRHKRSVLIGLTERGHAVIASVIDRETAVMQTLGADFDPAEVETALSVVLRLVDALKGATQGGAE
jgi:DNA-binding MarR family transcriptional regulator